MVYSFGPFECKRVKESLWNVCLNIRFVSKIHHVLAKYIEIMIHNHEHNQASSFEYSN